MKWILGALTVAISVTVTWAITELLDRPRLSFDVAAVSIETRTGAKTIFRPSPSLHIGWERVPWVSEQYSSLGMSMEAANAFEKEAATYVNGLKNTKEFFQEAIDRLNTVNDSYPDDELRAELLQGHVRLPGNYFWTSLRSALSENRSLYSVLQQDDRYNKHPEPWDRGPEAIVRFSDGLSLDLSHSGDETEDLLRRVFIYMDRRVVNQLFDTAFDIANRSLRVSASFHGQLTEELSRLGKPYLVARFVVTNAGKQTDAVLGKTVVAIGSDNHLLVPLQAVKEGTLSPIALMTVPGHDTRVIEFISKDPVPDGTVETQQGSLTLEALKEVYKSELLPAKFVMTNARTDDYWSVESSFGASAEQEQWKLLSARAGL